MDGLYDLIIIGGGPAGITAGIYASRQGIKTLLLTDDFGGQMKDKAVAIENYTGFEEISGAELLEKFEKHLKQQKIIIKDGKVTAVKKKQEHFSVLSQDGASFESRAVIVATGAKPRQLAVAGEKKFLGKGMSYCVACDGPVFLGKEVAVVGGGNSGLEAAAFLSAYTKKIYILEYDKEVRGEIALLEAIKKNPKVEIITNAQLQEIKGDKFVRSVVYKDLSTGQEKEIFVSGVFSEIGHQPDTSFLGDLADKNKREEIIIDHRTNETKTPGLFAAGDVTDLKYKQIIIAAGEGAKAALSALNFINNL